MTGRSTHIEPTNKGWAAATYDFAVLRRKASPTPKSSGASASTSLTPGNNRQAAKAPPRREMSPSPGSTP